MNWSNEQLKGMAGQTAEQAGERICKLAKEAGFGPVKQHMLFEVARVAATLMTLSTLIAAKKGDPEALSTVSMVLSEHIPTNLLHTAVLGLVDDDDVEALKAGPDKLAQLAQDAMKIMVNELTGTLQAANLVASLAKGKSL